MAGTVPTEIAQLMGHSNVGVTQEVYSHWTHKDYSGRRRRWNRATLQAGQAANEVSKMSLRGLYNVRECRVRWD